jgi:hypothetical protein
VLHTSTSFGQHLLLRVETSIGAKPPRKIRWWQIPNTMSCFYARQLGAQHNGRVRHESMGQGAIPGLQCRKPSQGCRASVDARCAERAEL